MVKLYLVYTFSSIIYLVLTYICVEIIHKRRPSVNSIHDPDVPLVQVLLYYDNPMTRHSLLSGTLYVNVR